MKKKEKKAARKEEKKTRAMVKEVFLPDGGKKETNPLVESLVKSVLVNRAVIKRDKKAKKKWQNDYYQTLFTEFRKLVKKHNEIYEFKAEKLQNDINVKRTQLKTLKAEIKKAEAEKELKNA